MKQKRLALWLAGSLIVSLAGGVVGWLTWAHSPMYSLHEVRDAIQDRDRYKFERYVDVDGVIQSFIADFTSSNPLAMAMANAMSATLKQQVTKALEDGTGTDTQVGPGVAAVVSGKTDLHLVRQGPNAYFLLPMKTKGGAPFDLRVHMTQVPDGYWRVDRVVNVKDLMAAEAAEDAARKAAHAKEIEEKLSQLSVVARLHTSVSPDGWTRMNRFQIKFQNKGPAAISRMTGHITDVRTDFDEGISGRDLNLGPGESGNFTWEFRVNQFMAPTEKMYARGDTPEFQIRVDSVVLADGTVVKRDEED